MYVLRFWCLTMAVPSAQFSSKPQDIKFYFIASSRVDPTNVYWYGITCAQFLLHCSLHNTRWMTWWNRIQILMYVLCSWVGHGYTTSLLESDEALTLRSPQNSHHKLQRFPVCDCLYAYPKGEDYHSKWYRGYYANHIVFLTVCDHKWESSEIRVQVIIAHGITGMLWPVGTAVEDNKRCTCGHQTRACSRSRTARVRATSFCNLFCMVWLHFLTPALYQRQSA